MASTSDRDCHAPRRRRRAAADRRTCHGARAQPKDDPLLRGDRASAGTPAHPRRLPCYGVDDRERLRFIARAKAIGLSLQEISEILAIRQAGNPPCRHVAAVLDRKLAVLEARIRSLTDLHREITELRRDTAGMVSCDATICAIIEHHDRIAEPLDLPVDWKD